MGMGKLIMWGAVGLTAMSVGGYMEGQQEEAAVVKYELTAQQTSLMRQCKSSMESGRVKFKQGASKTAGCACIVKKVSPNMTDNQMKYATANLKELFSHGANPSNKTRLKMINNLDKIQKKYRLNNEQSQYVFKKLMTSMSYCSKNA